MKNKKIITIILIIITLFLAIDIFGILKAILGTLVVAMFFTLIFYIQKKEPFKIGVNFMTKKRKKTNNTKSKKRKTTNSSKNSKKITRKKPTTKKKATAKKKTTKRKKEFIIFKKLVTSVLIIGILGVIASGAFIYKIVVDAPEFNVDNLYSKESTLIYDSSGNEIATIGLEKREKITYEDLNENLINAVVATEDSRFFQHNGFDLLRFIKATIGQLTYGSSAGGASTISMQVIKNNFTSTNQTITRKLTDIYLSVFELEKKYTKEEILEFYVNSYYLGSGAYGVEMAAQTYFSKSSSELSLPEAALIAGLFQAPGSYDPNVNPERAENRRNTVLSLMELHGYITSEEREIAESISIEDMLVSKKTSANKYQGYVDTVIEEVKEKTGSDPYVVPMKIYTNLVPEKQDYIESILNEEIYEYENDLVQHAITVIENDTGKLIAVGAGRDRSGELSYNYATMIKRQCGSTAKPLFDYGPAFEFLNWSTYHPLLDDAYTYSDGTPIHDWDHKYRGLLTLRAALSSSRNITALQAFQAVPNSKIIEFVTSLGITPEISGGFIHEAHAIGGFNGVSPLELNGAYAAIANGGYYIEPYSVNKIIFRDTNEEVTYSPAKTRVMEESTAYMITNVIDTATSVYVSGVNISGKTGTTNFDEETRKAHNLSTSAINDLWTAVYSPTYSFVQWYGYDTIDSDYYSTSATWSIRDYLADFIAEGVLKDDKGTTFTRPSNIVSVTVEKETVPGSRPSAYTPSDMKVTELFIKGTEPTEVSPRYDKLNTVKNVASSYSSNKNIITWDYNLPDELTDEYLKQQYLEIYGSTFRDKYLSLRISDDLSRLGTLGFYVYSQNENGELSLLGYTTEKTFTHNLGTITNLDITYVIKTGYSKFKSNMSDGVTLNVDLSEEISLIDITLNGDEIVNLNVGDTFTDEEVTVTDNFTNVTSSATITKTITNSSDVIIGTIDTSFEETYTITYEIVYEDTTETLTRTVNVSSIEE